MIWRSEANTSIKIMLETENSFGKIHCVQEKNEWMGIYFNWVNFKPQENISALNLK